MTALKEENEVLKNKVQVLKDTGMTELCAFLSKFNVKEPGNPRGIEN